MIVHNPSQQPVTRDVHVLAAAESRLRTHPYGSLRTVVCRFDRGCLVLDGRLPSFFHKQLAQEAVADIEGVDQVVNQIEVSG